MLGFAIFALAYSLSLAWLFSGGIDYIDELIRRTK